MANEQPPSNDGSIIKIGNTEISARGTITDTKQYDLTRIVEYLQEFTIRPTEFGSHKIKPSSPTVQMYIDVDWGKLKEAGLSPTGREAAIPVIARALKTATGVDFEVGENARLAAEMTTAEYIDAMKAINEAIVANQQSREASWVER